LAARNWASPLTSTPGRVVLIVIAAPEQSTIPVVSYSTRSSDKLRNPGLGDAELIELLLIIKKLRKVSWVSI
jgi:hypothetical protein